MKTKQIQIRKQLPLLKRLVPVAVFSFCVASTTAMACTHVDTQASNGCPAIGSNMTTIANSIQNLFKSRFLACDYVMSFPYTFDVYYYEPGQLLGSKGNATATWKNSNTDYRSCIELFLVDPAHIQLDSVSSVKWTTGLPKDKSKYDPSSYQQCCTLGT